MDKAIGMSRGIIDSQEITAITRRIGKALDEIADKNQRQKMSEKAASFVVNSARAKAPRSQKVHYVYRTPKLSKGVRAARGSATKYRTAYLPGNLSLSIRRLGGLRRTIRSVIGPRVLRNARAKTYGRNEKNVNAFYAQMIYGSAIAFRDKIMIPALREQEGRIVGYLTKQIDIVKKKAAAKYGL
jgi:hypothetical protein